MAKFSYESELKGLQVKRALKTCTGLSFATPLESNNYKIVAIVREPRARTCSLTENSEIRRGLIFLADLKGAYPAGNALFACERVCHLSQISICWSNQDAKIGDAIACPSNVTNSHDGNCCELDPSCEMIKIPRSGQQLSQSAHLTCGADNKGPAGGSDADRTEQG